jgi:hypothetical protein
MVRSVVAQAGRLGILMCGVAVGGTALAQTLGTLDQKVWVRLGAFHPDIDTTARIDTASGTSIGTELSFEALGLPRKKTLPTLLVGARLGSAWRAEFEYFRLSRSGSSTLDAQIAVDDTVYAASARLDIRIVSDIYRLSGGYSFIKTSWAELGAVAGLHVTQLDIGIAGTGTVAGQATARATEEQRQTVPLPTLGLYGALAFAPGWQSTARVDYFSLRRGGYDGRLVNAQANVLYRFTPQVALGAGWRIDDYKVSADRSTFRGRLQYRFTGPQAFVEAAF